MTAPLTPSPPPDEQPPHGPWQTPAQPSGATSPHGYGRDGDGLRAEVVQAAVVMVAVAVAGVLLGALWMWLAPRVPLVSDGKAVYLKDTEGEQAIATDGTFTLLSLGFGLVSGVVVFLLRKRGGIPLVAGLAVGSLLGALLAWRVGIFLGPETDVVAHAKSVGKGVVFDAPLELKAMGTVLAWPVAALAVHLGLTGLFGPRDPEPYLQDPEPYPGA
ncbi:DUF2567 domain-containing protein [Streptomyces venezuelae]|uniref:DUF2567 domain-containing protein n=1 Tax=Streptomyces venezuelae TaxID=54571 RepID=A0A5P2C2F9_STRVZ|nr:DUF2567 domain-containing protein [Streptomyces venezuelae]QES36906.1 DUF2567 domain-containing protein [Streptomyces venezuelae]